MHRVAGQIFHSVLRRNAKEQVLNVQSGKFGFFVCRHGSISTPNSPKRHYMARAAQEPFLNGSSSVYVEEMYKAWLQDPASVHKVI